MHFGKKVSFHELRFYTIKIVMKKQRNVSYTNKQIINMKLVNIKLIILHTNIILLKKKHKLIHSEFILVTLILKFRNQLPNVKEIQFLHYYTDNNYNKIFTK